MKSRIYRYEIPVDDKRHTFTLHADPKAWACRDPYAVEFWARHYEPGEPRIRATFLVVGTGHVLPDEPFMWVATVPAPNGLVWHVLEMQP